MKKYICLFAILFSVNAILGYNSKGYSHFRYEGSITSKFVPTTPQNFNVDRVTNKWNSVTFNWSSVVGATSYMICWQRKTDGVTVPFSTAAVSYGSKIINGNSTTTITLTDADLKIPMNFYLYVVAINSTGTSAPSNLVLYDSPPSTPTNFNVTILSTTSVQLNWDAAIASDEVFGYYVYDGDNAIGFVGTATPTLTVSGLETGSTHSFSVEALDCYMNSSFTAFDGKYYCIPYFYDFPRDYSCVTNVKIGTSSNSSVYNDKNYNDYSQDFSKNDFEIYKNSTKNVIEVTIAPQKFDMFTNMYAFIDYNQDGLFSTSESITFGSLYKQSDTLGYGLNVPITFISNAFTTPSSALTGNTTIRIFLKRSNYGNGSSNESCLQTGQGEAEDYLIYIGAGLNRMSNPKQTISLNKATITLPSNKIAEVQSIDDVIKIYPNPVLGDIINITAVDNNTPYRIINMLGQEVGAGTVANGIISVTNLSQGTYLIELKTKNQNVLKHFIKQ